VLGLDGAGLDPFVLAPDRADAVRASLRLDTLSVLVGEISRDATRELQSPAAARLPTRPVRESGERHADDGQPARWRRAGPQRPAGGRGAA